MDGTGYIYVLTNPSFHKDDWIKIGYAENVDRRVKELSNTSVPLPFEVYCTYEIPRIEGVRDPDKLLHDLISKLNPGLRIVPNREFFEMLPWDAYEMLFAIAQMHGRTDKLKRNDANTSGEDIQDNDDRSTDNLFPVGSEIRGLVEKIKSVLLSEDSTLVEVPTLNYVTFKKGKNNTVSLWPHVGWIEVVLNAKIGQITDDSGIVYDISNRKWSSAQYAFKFYKDSDMGVVRNILKQVLILY